MPFVPAENVVLVEMRFRAFGQRIENTLWMKHQDSSDWTHDTAEQVADALLGNFSALGDICFCPDVVLHEIQVTDMTTATSPAWIFPAGDLAGVHSGNSLPLNATLAISFRTAGRGRSSRGRNYVPALPEDEVIGNTVDNDYLTLIQDYYVGIASAIDGIDSPAALVVVSRMSGGEPRETALVQPITSITVTDGYVDSQRRRLTGRGL